MEAFVPQSADAHLDSSESLGVGGRLGNRLLMFVHGRESLTPSKLPGISLSYSKMERTRKKAIMRGVTDTRHK